MRLWGDILLRSAVALAIASAAQSCTYKELCYNHGEHSGKAPVTFLLDWSHLAEYPTGMTVRFYPTDGGKPVQYLTNDVDSVVVELPVGTYNIIAFNQSVEEYVSVTFHDMDSWDDMYIEIADAQKPDWARPGGNYSREPAELLVGTETGFAVTQYMLEAGGGTPVTISLKPHPVAVRTDIVARLIGIQYAGETRGTISGMAKRFYLTRNRTGSETTTIALSEWTAAADNRNDKKKSGRVSTQFVSFGLPEVQYTREELEAWGTKSEILSPQDLSLDMQILLIDRVTMVNACFNVSDRYSFPEDIFNMMIDVGIPLKEGRTPLDDSASVPIELPEIESGGSGGFVIDVEDWGEDIEYDVIIK